MSSIDKPIDIEKQQVQEPAAAIPSTDKNIEGTTAVTGAQASSTTATTATTATTTTTTGAGMTSASSSKRAGGEEEKTYAGEKDLPAMMKAKSLPEVNKPYELSTADNLYITSVVFSAFASALSFGGIPYSTENTNAIFETYAAFAYLYLIFSHKQTVILIIGLGRPGEERSTINGMTMILTILNMVLLIIAISTFGSTVPITIFPPFRQSCLIIALGIELFVLVFQLMGYRHIKSLPKGSTGYYFPPLSFSNPAVSNMLISNAVLCCITFAFGLGGLSYPSYFTSSPAPIIQASVAFSILFFFSSIVSGVTSIIALVPGPSIEPIIVVTWIFSLCSFVFSFLTFILQAVAFGGVAGIIVFFLIAWIFSLASFCVGISAWFLMSGRVGEYCCRCDDMNSEIAKQRNIVQVEKARLEALKLRKERENLELAQS